MIPDGTSPEAIIIVVVGTTLVGCGLMVALFWYRWSPRVNRSQEDSTDVMSRDDGDPHVSTPSSLRQTAQQTDRQTALPPLSREVMLDIYKLLREHSVPREKARPVLKAAGISLDNNLWTLAAPDEDTQLTPIAGRPTKASYYQDPELEFQPPPR